jgi:ABC-type sulfate/molybdate transport systems ATPase subunit
VALEVQIEKKLRDFRLDLSFTAGDLPLSILGPSGSGKTMLLRCIAGLERPDRGTIALNGRVLTDATKRIHVPARARRVGMLFQHYALFPHRTLGENLAFGLNALPRDGRLRRVADWLARTHIGGLEHRYPQEVSGGEQQRAALARALATEPEALLLDEPLSALDTHLRSQMEAQLQETFATFRRPALLVTHNIEEAYRLGEQMMVLSRGRIAALGPKDAIFRSPPNMEVALLTGCKNFSRARAISSNVIEALDWNCTLQVTHPIERPPAYVGIRAHHIGFIDPSQSAAANQNVFSCWVARSSETPFRVTLYLSPHRQPGSPAEHYLQAEVFKEKWEGFRNQAEPLQVRLPPEALFLLPE